MTNVTEFEIARYKQSSKHVQQKLQNAIYSNSTLFHLLSVKYGRKKYRNDAFEEYLDFFMIRTQLLLCH